MAGPAGNDPSDRLGPAGVVQRLWEGDAGRTGRLLGPLLVPAELAFRAAVRVRDTLYRTGVLDTATPAVPTISVGNITVGGTGKTPLVRWLVGHLAGRGWTPGILHGGYAEDEPELHRRWFPGLPVVADRNRTRGAGLALARGADVLVLDDAFQHRRLGRHLDIVLVAAETWTLDARLLPRGPYREAPGALGRADITVVTRRTASPEVADRAETEAARLSGRRSARVHLRPGAWLGADGAERTGPPPGPALAVAGVGRPADFFDQAAAAGARLAETLAFPDHHPYRAAEVAELLRLAAGGPLVTTAKDAVKLAPLAPDADLWVLDQQVVFESGEGWLLDAVDGVLP